MIQDHWSSGLTNFNIVQFFSEVLVFFIILILFIYFFFFFFFFFATNRQSILALKIMNSPNQPWRLGTFKEKHTDYQITEHEHIKVNWINHYIIP